MVSSRTRLAMTTASVLAAVAVGATLLTAGGDPGGAGNDSGYRGSLLPERVPVVGFDLTDQDGSPTRSSALEGGPALVTFLYTSCRDICPLTAQQIRGAMDQVGHDVPVVAISVDPRNDTPAAVRSWLAREGLWGRFQWGLGTESRLAPVWKAWGIAPQGPSSDHSAYVFLLDRDGRRCVSWPVSQLTPEGLAHDIRLLEARSGNCRG